MVNFIFIKTTTLDRITSAALVGRGNYPKSGEISLFHNGVLFLDEDSKQFND